MTLAIGIFNGKGGVTKSALARSIAVVYTSAGWDTLIADMDIKNGTSTKWALRRMAAERQPVIAVQTCGTAAQLKKIVDADVHDLVIADGGAYASDSLPGIISNLNMAILPTAFTTDDLDTTIDTANGLIRKGVPLDKICIVLSGATESKTDYQGALDYLGETNYFTITDEYIPRMPSLGQLLDKGCGLTESTFPSLRKRSEAVIQSIIDRLEFLTNE